MILSRGRQRVRSLEAGMGEGKEEVARSQLGVKKGVEKSWAQIVRSGQVASWDRC